MKPSIYICRYRHLHINYFRVTGAAPTVTLLLGIQTPAADSGSAGGLKNEGKPHSRFGDALLEARSSETRTRLALRSVLFPS